MKAIPFTEAIEFLAQKKLLPTNMTTLELRTLDKAVREQSFFSARNYLTDVLDKMKADVASILNPSTEGGVTQGMDIATSRLELRKKLAEEGYLTEEGEVGSITDLSSDARLNLVLKTNVQMAQGFGFQRQSQDEDVLDEYPALELIRAEDRDVPRGKKRGKGGKLVNDEENSWPSRFQEAGDACGRPDGWGVFDGRMIALVNHPIWDELGSSDLFDDGLDNSYPPFAFNSGMDVERVGRDEAVELGLIGEDDVIQPRLNNFTVGVGADEGHPFGTKMQMRLWQLAGTWLAFQELAGKRRRDPKGRFIRA